MARVRGETVDVLARSESPQSLIITIYGAYSRPLGGWMAVSSLLELLRSLGVEDAASRSALSRLKRKEVLIAERRDGVHGYRIGDATRRIFEIGDARVLHRRSTQHDHEWVLVTFSIPESSRDIRYRLRSRLARVGFGQVSPGLWIGPSHLETDVRHVIERLEITEFVQLFTGEYLGFGATKEAVRQWWDLAELALVYDEFVDAYRPMSRSWARISHIDAEAAFVDYTQVLTSWRPIPYLDPGLPDDLLPTRWPGRAAADVFFGLRDRLAKPAAQHVTRIARN